MITQVLESSAVWGVLLTLAAFGLGVLINKRTGKAIFNPLLLGTAFGRSYGQSVQRAGTGPAAGPEP